MTKDQIAAQLEAEAEGLAAHKDPVIRAAAKRLLIVAEFVMELPGPDATGMLVSKLDNQTRAELGKQYSRSRGLGVSPIAAAAHRAGLSLRALAAACEIPHSYLSQLAKGERPVPEKVVSKVAELTGWTDWPRRSDPTK